MPNKPTIRQLDQSNRSSKHSNNATGQTGKTTLPQTGEKKSNYNLAGMILALLGAFLFAFPGKKRND
ncbi:LPXTG cell wall anchor domain-containing protein [Lactobacillus equicursoris]|uniref:LPXTG cell wall anchor domain-containing protein n=1 Tax=Lactobacillus equicursoris TaxID=420645 RepID=UPI003C6CCC5E